MYYLAISDEFRRLAQPVAPERDEAGVEAFYAVSLTPWARLTGNIQGVRPSRMSREAAIVTGLRLQLRY